MIARYSASISIGSAVTFCLLFLMQHLIATGAEAVTEFRNHPLGDFVRVIRDEVIEVERQLPDKPLPPDLPPELPRTQMIDENTTIPVSVAGPSVNTIVSLNYRTVMVSDGEYLPIMKVAPAYPARALIRGLEGHVIVEFTVTRSGTVRDAFAVDSTSSIFEQAAIEAALKFKYKPRVIDGTAVEVPGVQNKFTFEISN